MTTLLTERYRSDLQGVLSCYDRIVITGTLPGVCYARGMTSYFYAHQIKVFDYVKEFADPLRNKIRDNAQMIAKAHGVRDFFRRDRPASAPTSRVRWRYLEIPGLS
jgi:hypothetical protein